MRLDRKLAYLIVLVPAAVYLVFLVAPTVNTFRMSLNSFTRLGGLVTETTADNYRTIKDDSFYHETWIATLRLTVLSTVATVATGTFVAYCLWRAGGRLRQYLTLLLLAPLLVSGVVRAYGWMAIAGPRGPIHALQQLVGLEDMRVLFTEKAVVMAFVHALMPLVVVIVLTRLDTIAPSVISAASSLGAGPVRIAFRVVLPLVRQGIIAATLLIASIVIGAYSTPAILGGGRVFTVAQLIYQNEAVNFNWPMSAALAICLTVSTMLAMTAYLLLGSRRDGRAVSGAL